MAKKVYVTGAQSDAARFLSERTAAKGDPVPQSVSKIAGAKLTTHSAVLEKGGGGVIKSSARRAISRRFIITSRTPKASKKTE